MKNLLPHEAWALLQSAARQGADGQEDPDEAPLFVDVRMEIESLYVGRPPGVENIPWYEYPDLTPDATAFAGLVEREAGGKDRTVLLICRSGKRSLDAARGLVAAGFTDVVNVVHGFEGDLNETFQRSRLNGWRFDGRRSVRNRRRAGGPATGPPCLSSCAKNLLQSHLGFTPQHRQGPPKKGGSHMGATEVRRRPDDLPLR